MDKQQVIAVIKENMEAVADDIDITQIDPQKEMIEYGIYSLDMLKVISNTMRKLDIRVPSTELSNTQSIDELAGVFYRYVKNKNSNG